MHFLLTFLFFLYQILSQAFSHHTLHLFFHVFLLSFTSCIFLYFLDDIHTLLIQLMLFNPQSLVFLYYWYSLLVIIRQM